ncbi:MAG: site-specific DNA-methyltransferase [Zoogloeaceae bacterium]|nr:site-specific DNA-methyltransferase [Zoogloeaceae bacterium]
MPLLDWLDKDRAVRAARAVPYRLLDPVPELAHGFAGDDGGNDGGSDDNLLIQGDNLDALKALLPLYAGKVKCIYIDPPYNTRSAFEHYDDNLEHSVWLSMMYPLLELLRELLAEDGSMWVSIDDNEGHYLKVVMDELFGRRNFVTSFVWQKVDSPNDNKVPITPDHEYVICYEKQKDHAGFRKKQDSTLLDAYSKRDKRGRLYRDRLLKKNGKNSLRADRPTMFYPLTAPSGEQVFPVHDDGREARWSHSEDGVKRADDEGRLIWKHRKKDGREKWVPYIREYAPDDPVRPHPTILLDVKTTRQAKAHQRVLLPNQVQFDTVKPEQLVARVFEIATNPGDLVLDSFLGSGTTAAVAHKMGRRWIGIEMGEHAVTHCQPRLKQVVDGEQGGISRAVGWQGGGGFRFYRLGATAFDADGHIHPDIDFPTLAGYVWFLETGAARGASAVRSALLGVHAGTAYYLLYNGILGDRRPQGGNVLTGAVLAGLPPHPDGPGAPRVIYGESTRLGAQRLAAEGITFKQIPYDVRSR